MIVLLSSHAILPIFRITSPCMGWYAHIDISAGGLLGDCHAWIHKDNWSTGSSRADPHFVNTAVICIPADGQLPGGLPSPLSTSCRQPSMLQPVWLYPWEGDMRCQYCCGPACTGLDQQRRPTELPNKIFQVIRNFSLQCLHGLISSCLKPRPISQS